MVGSDTGRRDALLTERVHWFVFFHFIADGVGFVRDQSSPTALVLYPPVDYTPRHPSSALLYHV